MRHVGARVAYNAPMIIDPKDHSSDGFYMVMLQSIIPRPIAWVLTENAAGTHNVAPFSFYNGVAGEPPLLMLAVGRKDDGARKDTWVNIMERSEFVVHVPPVELAAAMVATSKGLPYGESEVALAGLTLEAVEGERLPRIKGARVALFCRRHSITEVGAEKLGLILGEVTKIWADDAVARAEGSKIFIDPKKVDPLMRLGGADYARLGEVFPVKRPG